MMLWHHPWRADREAEGARLLSEYRMQILSGVRIPSSPPDCSSPSRAARGGLFSSSGNDAGSSDRHGWKPRRAGPPDRALVSRRASAHIILTHLPIVLDGSRDTWHYSQSHAALPQLDRGPDYESGRHRFESYTPHHANLGAPSGAPFALREIFPGSPARPVATRPSEARTCPRARPGDRGRPSARPGRSPSGTRRGRPRRTRARCQRSESCPTPA